MNIWKFIKPDNEVMCLLFILFILSVAISIFIPGDPGYLCGGYPYGCRSVSGIGLPFAWTNLTFIYTYPPCNENAGGCRAGVLPPKSVNFDLINLVLDIIILYIVALLAVRIYDAYFRKKKKK
jgi:hypothetical protein